jgi:hypothetical protein
LKYKKVKGLYFDGLARREALEKQLIDAGITPMIDEREIISKREIEPNPHRRA